MTKFANQFESKFSKLTEQAVSRFEQGGYINGDYVKLRANYKSSDFYKRAAEHIQAKLDEIATSDLNLRVSGVKSLRTNMSPVKGNANAPDDFYVDIALEIAPGLYPEHITVPLDLIQMVDTADAMGRMPVPDSQVYKANIHGAEEVETSDKDRSNPKKDTKIKGGNKWQDTPGGGNAPKKTIFEKKKKDEDMLEEAYTSIYKKKVIEESGPQNESLEDLRTFCQYIIDSWPDSEYVVKDIYTIADERVSDGANEKQIVRQTVNDLVNLVRDNFYKGFREVYNG